MPDNKPDFDQIARRFIEKEDNQFLIIMATKHQNIKFDYIEFNDGTLVDWHIQTGQKKK